MNIEDMSVNDVWQWLAEHYPTAGDYLLALAMEQEAVRLFMEDPIITRQKRWGESVLKLLKKYKEGKDDRGIDIMGSP